MLERADTTLRGKAVLVVEDEALVAMELASVLRQQGCVVGKRSAFTLGLGLDG